LTFFKPLNSNDQIAETSEHFVLLIDIKMIMKTLRFVLPVLIVIALSSFQIIKTTLTVTVRDELGNIVEGAKVQLFENEADYTAEKNVAAEGVTDKKGILKLKELKAIAYYVIVRKDDKDNSGGGEQVGKLEEKKINKVTIIIQ
jgi:hypothetical protein